MILCSAHDAGGANLLLHYIRKRYYFQDLRLILTGPAITIAENLGMQYVSSLADIEWELHTSYICASSHSKPPKLHDELLKISQERGIPTIGILDGWENYEQRWQYGLPGQIWVMDTHALALSKESFPNKAVRLIENFYLEYIRENIPTSNGGIDRKSVCLYLDSPRITQYSSVESDHNLACICNILSEVQSLYGVERIIVRPHPRTNPMPCVKSYSKKNKKLRLEISPNKHLYEDLGKTEIVVGKPSYALFIAKELGFKCFATDQFENKLAPQFNQINS